MSAAARGRLPKFARAAAQPQGAGFALGFVVAGGRSERMGSDKALLRWGAGTLLDHAVARLRPLCGQIFLLSGAEARYPESGLDVLLDAWPQAGPLGGILAGLERLDHRPGVFLAVDVPAVPTALLARLLALLPEHDAAVPLLERGAEPLVAVYTRACLAAVRRRLAAGERKSTCFWPDVKVRTVTESELSAFGHAPDLFTNVNAPEDYARLLARSALSEE